MRLTTILALLCFQSCLQDKKQNEQVFASLKECSHVDMVYYNHDDTLIYKTNDSLEIASLTELISNKDDIIGDSCKPAGRLVFKKKELTIFSAEFSTTNTNEKVDCNYVVYKIEEKTYKHKLTYRAGMFMDDILWHGLKWSSLSSHGPIRLHGDTGIVENKKFIKTLQRLSRDTTNRDRQ